MEVKSLTVAETAQMMAQQNEERTRNMKAGLPALARLVDVALRDTGQSHVCGRFLLGLYNGQAYCFDLTELRRLDSDLLEDCLHVLRMDSSPLKEVHELISNGEQIFHDLRMAWATCSEISDWAPAEQEKWHSLRT